MKRDTPLATIEGLIASRSERDLAAALEFYEPGASVVAEPGKVGTGLDAIRAFTAATMDLPIQFGSRTIVEAGDLALHVSEWTIVPPSGESVHGRTADVLRRQVDGSWLLAIDNPWGVALLGQTAP